MEDLKKFLAVRVVVVPWGHKKDLSSRVCFREPYGKHHILLVNDSGAFKSVTFVDFECGMELTQEFAENIGMKLGGLPVEIDVNFYMPPANNIKSLTELIKAKATAKEKELVRV